MTCQEIHEQITAFVDNRIDQDEYRRKVQDHISYCSECRTLYEMELMTKLAVNRHGQRNQAPPGLRESISAGVADIDAERRAAIERERPDPDGEADWLDRFAGSFVSPVGVAIATLIVLASASAIWNPFAGTAETQVQAEYVPPPPPKELAKPDRALNFFNAAVRNFDLLQAGELAPDLTTSDAKAVEEHLRSAGVSYSVVPLNVGVPLQGALVSEHRPAGQTVYFAHRVFGKDDISVYVFEVPKSAISEGNVVYLTEDSMNRLNSGETLWEESGERRTLAIFAKGNNVLAAVGNVNRPTLQSLLPL